MLRKEGCRVTMSDESDEEMGEEKIDERRVINRREVQGWGWVVES